MLQTEATIDDVIAEAARLNAHPLWKAAHARVAAPNPACEPYRWKYAELRPLLDLSGKLISAEEADRRVFMLINPKGVPPCTTETMAANYQLILPGECAPAHRHTPFALRFIIEGTGAFSAVNGEKVYMDPGDLILTPSWSFHDHGNEGAGPVVWLDGLDVPLVTALKIQFFEASKEPRLASRVSSGASNLRYPWAVMKSDLDALPGSHAVAPYLQRIGRRSISRTIGAQAERIDAGTATSVRQSTQSYVYVVRTGHGRTHVGSEILEWAAGDTLAIPAWQPFHHVAGSETAYLFAMHDRPLIDALGYYQERSVET